MACPYKKKCELFSQIALNRSLNVWKVQYCYAEFKRCVRHDLYARGDQVPSNLLPNGQAEQAPRSAASYGATALFNAIVKERQHMIDSLLRTGVDINVRNGEGLTPLMAAATIGNVEIARQLLTKGADPRAVNNQGETASDIAARLGFARITEVLTAYVDTSLRAGDANAGRAPQAADEAPKAGFGSRLKNLFQVSK